VARPCRVTAAAARDQSLFQPVKRLAVDIGGAFTDVVYRDADGAVQSTKVPTALDDVTLDVFAGIATRTRREA